MAKIRDGASFSLSYIFDICRSRRNVFISSQDHRSQVQRTCCSASVNDTSINSGDFAPWKNARVIVTARSGDGVLCKRCCQGGRTNSEMDNGLRIFEAPLLERDPVIIMAGCRHNVIESLKCRYLKHTPNIGKLDMDLVMKIVEHLADAMRPSYQPEFSFNKFVKAKPGALRKRYLKAYKQMLNGEVSLSKIDTISAFVKNERYFEEGKSPRMIMGRDPRFNILYARFISRLEYSFFKLPQVANACDYWMCGEKFQKLLGAWMFENDMSKYESSQRKFHLYLEFLVYAKVVAPDEVSDLATLFAVKMKKKGRAEGVEFEFDFCRGSGDMDTSLGNGVINYLATMYFMIKNFCDKEVCEFETCGCIFDKFVLKGDDNYGKCPVGCKLNNTFLDWGFDAKLKLNVEPRKTEFCSGQFVELADGRFYYVQKLKKLIQSLEVCINPQFIKNGWVAHYYKSLGLMYSALYGSLPIYCDIAAFLLTASDKFGINTNLTTESYGANEGFKHHKHNIQKVDVCDITYADIVLNNDLSFTEAHQLALYFQKTALIFPPEFSRRCNLKTTKTDDNTDVCEDITTSFSTASMRKDCKVWRKELMTLFYAPKGRQKDLLLAHTRSRG